jgi:hypothetical protein
MPTAMVDGGCREVVDRGKANCGVACGTHRGIVAIVVTSFLWSALCECVSVTIAFSISFPLEALVHEPIKIHVSRRRHHFLVVLTIGRDDDGRNLMSSRPCLVTSEHATLDGRL